jgi:predicted kinase
MAKKLLILQGLPASGKSTIAKNLEKKGWKIAEKDVIRKLSGLKSEQAIKNRRDALITEWLAQGCNVVSSDTNLHPPHVPHLIKVGEATGADVSVRFIDTPVDECIRRDAQRENKVGAHVIRMMYNRYLKDQA